MSSESGVCDCEAYDCDGSCCGGQCTCAFTAEMWAEIQALPTAERLERVVEIMRGNSHLGCPEGCTIDHEGRLDAT